MDPQSNHPSEYPANLAEAVDWLESILPADELECIAAMEQGELADLHFELGA